MGNKTCCSQNVLIDEIPSSKRRIKKRNLDDEMLMGVK